MSSKDYKGALGAIPWLLIILGWYGVRASGFVNPALIPAPHTVAVRFYELITREGIVIDAFASSRRVFIGVAVGIALAVPVGFLLGWFPTARILADPLVNFFRALPPIALIPQASPNSREPASTSIQKST